MATVLAVGLTIENKREGKETIVCNFINTSWGIWEMMIRDSDLVCRDAMAS